MSDDSATSMLFSQGPLNQGEYSSTLAWVATYLDLEDQTRPRPLRDFRSRVHGKTFHAN